MESGARHGREYHSVVKVVVLDFSIETAIERGLTAKGLTKTDSLVWRGIATDEKASPADVAKKLDDMVRKVIAKYPPKK